MAQVQEEWEAGVTRWMPFAVEEFGDPEAIHETYFLREMPLYIDFMDHEQRWSMPREDIAEYTYSTGGGVTDAQAALDHLRKTSAFGFFSPESLSIINDQFKKNYITEKTSIELVQSLHRKCARQIQSALGIPEEKYFESAVNEFPLYHFVTLRS